MAHAFQTGDYFVNKNDSYFGNPYVHKWIFEYGWWYPYLKSGDIYPIKGSPKNDYRKPANFFSVIEDNHSFTYVPVSSRHIRRRLRQWLEHSK